MSPGVGKQVAGMDDVLAPALILAQASVHQTSGQSGRIPNRALMVGD